jgi:hypothetical protein
VEYIIKVLNCQAVYFNDLGIVVADPAIFELDLKEASKL